MKYRLFTNTEKSADVKHFQNEDSYLFTEFSFMRDKKIQLMLIADGMGGLDDGDQASRNAIAGFMQSIYNGIMIKYLGREMEDYSLRYAAADVKAAMYEAIQSANKAVCDKADPYKQTGSTISAICIMDDFAVVANVGDSPVYLYRRAPHRLKLLSKLQTKAEQDVEEGAYDRYSEEYYQNNHILYSSLGQYSKLGKEDIHITAVGGLKAGDVILAGSDGAFGNIGTGILRELAADCNAESSGFVLTQLFEMAKRDKDDDQTAFIYLASGKDY